MLIIDVTGYAPDWLSYKLSWAVADGVIHFNLIYIILHLLDFYNFHALATKSPANLRLLSPSGIYFIVPPSTPANFVVERKYRKKMQPYIACQLLFNYSLNGSEQMIRPHEEEWALLTNEERAALLYYVLDPLKDDSMANSDENLCIKPHFRHIWIFLAIVFITVGILALIGNLYMIFVMLTELSLRRFINFLLLNLCISDIIKCVAVLPTSQMLLLLRHWFLGEAMCYLLPMCQAFSVIIQK